MFSIGTLVLTGLLGTVIGVVLGALLYKFAGPDSPNRKMRERAERAEGELKRYQQDVTDHFADTSKLVNNLTQSYRDVYEHLANSALKLTTPAISRQILESAERQLLADETTPLKEEPLEAPRDWAPKTGTGQLSEEYGLEDEDEAETATPQTRNHSQSNS